MTRIALAVSALLLSTSAFADGMPPDGRTGDGYRAPHRHRQGHVRPYGGPGHGRHGHHRTVWGGPIALPPSGPVVAVYTEPYIGKGLIYNVPPTLGWAAHAPTPVLRALN